MMKPQIMTMGAVLFQAVQILMLLTLMKVLTMTMGAVFSLVMETK